jgi:hypothetical protein
MRLSDLKHVYFCTGARNNDLLEHFNPEKLSFENDLTPKGNGIAGSTRLFVPGNQQFIDQRRPLGATLDEFGNDLNSKIKNEPRKKYFENTLND